MKIKIIFAILAGFILVGCIGPSDPQTKAKNKINANSPEFVADTSKGKLYRIWIDMGSSHNADRVYYFENATNNEITVNETVSNGKTSHTQTVVIIDGVEYIRK